MVDEDDGRSLGKTLMLLAGGALVGFGTYMAIRHPLRVLSAAGMGLLRVQGAQVFDAAWPHGTVRYVMLGTGSEPMVILHGFADSPASWGRVTADLGKRYRICMPVQVGHPGTDAPPDLEIDHAVRALDTAMIHAFGGARVNLVGHSLGGWVAALFAAAASERLRSLTLVNTAGFTKIKPDILMPSTKADAVTALRNVLGPAVDRIPDAIIDNYRRGMSERAEMAALRMMIDAPLLGEELSRIAVPTRVIGCSRDWFFGTEPSRTAASLIPGATLDIIEGGTHVPHMTDPAPLRELLRDVGDLSERAQLTT